ncbi:MAG: dipeptide epimerase [Fidelibacterota bacterium]|nr:MAG: dipeptide epimerase [Candidatus Neomarinimicrobiota bacterium]
MKITTLECWKQEFRLSEPYTIAYETIRSCANVFLRLETDAGIHGWGCAAPDLAVTGETGDSVLADFHDLIEPLLKSADPFSYTRINDELMTRVPGHPSARAMVDIALHDIIARQADVPLYKLLGGYRDCIPTSITIGILPIDPTVEKARSAVAQGFRAVKIKGGADPDEDIVKVVKVREVVGPDVELRFDANQGYTVEDAIRFIKGTEQAGIELLEQPTDKRNEELMKQVSQRASIPIMADESLMTLKDVFHLTAGAFTDMINIKLMKVGGITEALHINSVAKAGGNEVMVGCMDESALGISAGLHFALSRKNIIYADLDGHLDLIDDPFPHALRLHEGILYPTEKPGLGV